MGSCESMCVATSMSACFSDESFSLSAASCPCSSARAVYLRSIACTGLWRSLHDLRCDIKQGRALMIRHTCPACSALMAPASACNALIIISTLLRHIPHTRRWLQHGHDHFGSSAGSSCSSSPGPGHPATEPPAPRCVLPCY